MTQTFHRTVQPCGDWGNPHKCYACACAYNSQGAINDIAVALEALGIPCHIDQTGGMTMVGYCLIPTGGTESWDAECSVTSPLNYDDDRYWEGYDQTVAIERDWNAPESDYVNAVVAFIRRKAGK